jgi:hypothetical protein
VARSCQEILIQFGIIDVDVEIRESSVTSGGEGGHEEAGTV